MTSPLDVRVATADDAAALADLVNSAYRGDSSRVGWTTEADLLGGQRTDAEALVDVVARPEHVVLVHGDDAMLLACVQLERTGDGCYLGMLTVRPTRQGGGLGARLLATAEMWASTHWRARFVRMTVIVQRLELIAWYERRGYVQTGERQPFPYNDRRFGLPRRDDLEFVVLKKALTPAGDAPPTPEA